MALLNLEGTGNNMALDLDTYTNPRLIELAMSNPDATATELTLSDRLRSAIDEIETLTNEIALLRASAPVAET